MKKLILILVLSITSISFAQKTYEGTATVALIADDYASIVFGKNGHTPSSFIVKISDLNPDKAKLVEGKKYYFILKRVSLKGTKKTAEVYYHDVDRVQLNLDIRETLLKLKGNPVGL